MTIITYSVCVCVVWFWDVCVCVCVCVCVALFTIFCSALRTDNNTWNQKRGKRRGLPVRLNGANTFERGWWFSPTLVYPDWWPTARLWEQWQGFCWGIFLWSWAWLVHYTQETHVFTDLESFNNDSAALLTGYISIRNDSGTLILSASSEASVMVSIQTSFMRTVIELPESFMSDTRGLLGYFNGNPEDDFRLPNDTTLPHNLTEEEVYRFGLQCKWLWPCYLLVGAWFNQQQPQRIIPSSPFCYHTPFNYIWLLQVIGLDCGSLPQSTYWNYSELLPSK